MIRIAALLLLLTSVTSFAADPEPYLVSAPMPFYPPLARAARIQGSVTLQFAVDEHGDTLRVQGTSGHALLRAAAIENISNWKFRWPEPCACRVQRQVLFVYRLLGETADSPSTLVRWFGTTRVEIETEVPPINTQVSH